MNNDKAAMLAAAIGAGIGACIVLAVLLVVTARDTSACGCCADPVVKVEWDGNEWAYEFTDGSIVVTGTERLLCYEVVSGTAISEIRTKAGQDIECIYPQGAEQASGCIEAGRHDLSNVSFCNDGTTAVELSTFTVRAATQEPVKDDCECLTEWGTVRMLVGVGVGLVLGRFLVLVLRGR